MGVVTVMAHRYTSAKFKRLPGRPRLGRPRKDDGVVSECDLSRPPPGESRARAPQSMVHRRYTAEPESVLAGCILAEYLGLGKSKLFGVLVREKMASVGLTESWESRRAELLPLLRGSYTGSETFQTQSPPCDALITPVFEDFQMVDRISHAIFYLLSFQWGVAWPPQRGKTDAKSSRYSALRHVVGRCLEGDGFESRVFSDHTSRSASTFFFRLRSAGLPFGAFESVGEKTFSPLSDGWPMRDQKELELLSASIKEGGLARPILLDPDDSGVILCGRARYVSCLMAGVDPICRAAEIPSRMSKAEFVTVDNLGRPAYTDRKRTFIAARSYVLAQAVGQGYSRRTVTDLMHISLPALNRAVVVLKSGNEAMIRKLWGNHQLGMFREALEVYEARIREIWGVPEQK